MLVKGDRREEVQRENRLEEVKENEKEENRAVRDSYYLGVLNLRSGLKK